MTLRERKPPLTTTQIDQFLESLRKLRGDPSFARAVEEARKGNTRVAEGIWHQIYEDREKARGTAQKEQAEAARNLASGAVTNNIAEGLSWYRKATTLDPDDMEGWRGLGDAALAGGTLQESDEAFHRYVELARRAGNVGEIAAGSTGLGDVLVAQGKLDEALKSYRDSLAIAERLTASDRSNSGWQRDLAVSYNRVADVLVAQGKLDEALKSYRDSLGIVERLTASDRSNSGWQHDLAVSYEQDRRRAGGAGQARRRAHSGIASPLSSAWPHPIAATAVGSAISRCRTARSLRYLGNWDKSQPLSMRCDRVDQLW